LAVGIGPRRLKNIPEMVRVYRLAGVAGDDDNGAQRQLRLTRPSVALMPVIGGR
jgi:hypothetical protein